MIGYGRVGATQAEIEAACEMADFWRFNVHFANLLADMRRIMF